MERTSRSDPHQRPFLGARVATSAVRLGQTGDHLAAEPGRRELAGDWLFTRDLPSSGRQDFSALHDFTRLPRGRARLHNRTSHGKRFSCCFPPFFRVFFAATRIRAAGTGLSSFALSLQKMFGLAPFRPIVRRTHPQRKGHGTHTTSALHTTPASHSAQSSRIGSAAADCMRCTFPGARSAALLRRSARLAFTRVRFSVKAQHEAVIGRRAETTSRTHPTGTVTTHGRTACKANPKTTLHTTTLTPNPRPTDGQHTARTRKESAKRNETTDQARPNNGKPEKIHERTTNTKRRPQLPAAAVSAFPLIRFFVFAFAFAFGADVVPQPCVPSTERTFKNLEFSQTIPTELGPQF